nr:hypothetical protein [Tanacetum cinerariifolium]
MSRYVSVVHYNDDRHIKANEESPPQARHHHGAAVVVSAGRPPPILVVLGGEVKVARQSTGGEGVMMVQRLIRGGEGNGNDICQMVVIEVWRSGGCRDVEVVRWCAPAVAAESLAEDGRRRRKAWPEKGRCRKYQRGKRSVWRLGLSKDDLGPWNELCGKIIKDVRGKGFCMFYGPSDFMPLKPPIGAL